MTVDGAAMDMCSQVSLNPCHAVGIFLGGGTYLEWNLLVFIL